MPLYRYPRLSDDDNSDTPTFQSYNPITQSGHYKCADLRGDDAGSTHFRSNCATVRVSCYCLMAIMNTCYRYTLYML